MAEAIGLVVSIIGIVDVCTKVGAQIRDIRHRFVGAPAAVQSLAVDCVITATVLKRLQLLLQSRPQLLSPGGENSSQDLASSFDTLVQGLHDSVQVLAKEVSRIYSASKPRNGSGELGGTAKARYVWKESLLKELHGEIKEQRSSLCFLLDCINTESLVNVQIHLEGGRGNKRPPSPPNGAPSDNRSKLDMTGLSIQPIKPGVQISLPRELDKLKTRSLMGKLGLQPGSPYKSPDPHTTKKMHDAIDKKDIKTLDRILADRRDPNTPLPGSTLTPLHRALTSMSNSAVVSLALAGANLNILSEEGWPPIVIAVRDDLRYETIKLLCELGADVNAKTIPDGRTALHLAAQTEGSDKVIMALIAHGANLESKCSGAGWSPLRYAIRENNTSAARKLLDYGCDPNAESNMACTPLHGAVEGPGIDLDMVRLLCNQGADTTRVYSGKRRTYSPLTWAIRRGASVEVIGVLLAAGADISGKNPEVKYTPLQMALRHNPQVVPFLLEKGASLREKTNGGFPLHDAVKYAPTSTFEHLLLKHLQVGLNVDTICDDGRTPLIHAARNNKTDAISLLLTHGAYINFQSSDGDSPLSAALKQKSSRFDAARLLINLGADLEISHAPEEGAWKALHYACWRGPEDIIKSILDHGAPVDSRSKKHGITPLMVAARHGRIPIIQLLLSHGADLHARNNNGRDVLTYAVEEPATLQFLLSLGLDPNHTDAKGGTVLHRCVVRKANNNISARILLKAGAMQFDGEVFDTSERIYSGTPTQVARELGKIELAALIETWENE